ncbi:MAG: hypothetical protein JEZ04_22360 [Spirochaetales bacterium]|nr:hypothetical protein [Spirochaetales bacterium]
MKEKRKNQEEINRSICKVDISICEECSINGKLMCKLNIKDSICFGIPVITSWTIMIIGIVHGFMINNLNLTELIIFIVGYLGFLAFFFLLWENKVLCSHCPYYSFEEDKAVKCYANYGLHKAWKYNPSPMSKFEQIQFLIGISIFVIYPLVFLLIAQAFVCSILYIISSIVWIVSMHFLGCAKCPNFSCPLNNVPKNVVDEYLKKNPVMKKGLVTQI